MLSPYIASKARHHAFWAGMDPLLQEAGITLSSMCWHGWQWNAEPDKSPPRVPGANTRSIALGLRPRVTFYCSTTQKEDNRQFGAAMEAAAALSHGKTVLLVSPLQMSFLRHQPRCRSCESLAHAVRVLISMAKGTRARDDAQRHLKGNGGTDPLIVADTRLHSGELIDG